jgi:hypothetical protein
MVIFDLTVRNYACLLAATPKESSAFGSLMDAVPSNRKTDAMQIMCGVPEAETLLHIAKEHCLDAIGPIMDGLRTYHSNPL